MKKEDTNTTKLSRVLGFAELLNEFRKVERALYANGTERMENDVEHSFMLAMLAWYIIDSEKLTLDVSLVIKYALVHDLVEVYAGDTYAYTDDKEHLDSKEEREREASAKLWKNFFEFSELHPLIEKYEKKEDDESKFIYALDKIHPIINFYLDKTRSCKDYEITLQTIYDRNKEKVVVSSEIKPYFDELMELLKRKESKLFPKIS